MSVTQDLALPSLEDLFCHAAQIADALEIIERLWETQPNGAPIGYVTNTAKPMMRALLDGLELHTRVET